MTFDADPACRALQRSFEQNHEFGHMHVYDLFRLWLEAVWAFMDAAGNPDHFKMTLDKYTAAQGTEIGRMMFLYVEAVERNPFEDVLGELFMRLDVHSVRAGQFFTPAPVAEMMARMQFCREDFEAKVAEKGFISVIDPAVGAPPTPPGEQPGLPSEAPETCEPADAQAQATASTVAGNGVTISNPSGARPVQMELF